MEKPRVLVYVTSGTGNSLRVARRVAAKLCGEQEARNARVVQIEEARPIDALDPSSGQILGLVAPTHAFTTPWHMLRFACSLPRGRGNRAFVVITRAGLKLGRLFLPGVGGSNMYLLAFVLWLKGYDVRGVMGVDMPSNWYSLHPIQGVASQQAITKRAEAAVDRFAARMREGRRFWFSPGNVVEALLAVALAPLSALFLFWGRFLLAKLFFTNSKCNGCGICAESCPVGAIKMWGKERPRPYWRFTCESCMRCGALCPTKAIEAGHSWAVVVYLLASLPASLYALVKLRAAPPLSGILEIGVVRPLIVVPAVLVTVFLSYLAFFALNRLGPVNWLFSKTTLTHYWGRYREQQTSRRDLSIKRDHGTLQ
jgi:ferredoxin